MNEYDWNPHEKEVGIWKQGLCDECGERMLYDKRGEKPALCALCNPGKGNRARYCEYCWYAFRQRESENFQCCCDLCERLLAGQIRAGLRRPIMSPVQPWQREMPDIPDQYGENMRLCIDCGRLFVPNRGMGMVGKGRARLRCYACSPTKLVKAGPKPPDSGRR